nr:hypothetical protein [uncultured Desulfuromonas sp.]
MHHYMFAVDETPYCVWEHDMLERNMEFLNGIDCKYFEYISAVNFSEIDGDDKKRAAIALRSSYHHGLETLFMLIAALVQAPLAVFAYSLKCYPKDIKSIIDKINNGKPIYNKYGKTKISWDDISQGIHVYSNKDQNKVKENIECFAKLWQRFSYQYTDENNNREYNNIKHGFRARSGGFGITIQKERELGVPDPNEQPQPLGYSEFGSSFFVSENLINKKGPNFRARRNSLNWNPEAIAHSLNLISISINNIVSFLKMSSGSEPQEVIFNRPEDPNYFESPWKFCVGVTSSNFDFIIPENEINNFTSEEILEVIKQESTSKGKSS